MINKTNLLKFIFLFSVFTFLQKSGFSQVIGSTNSDNIQVRIMKPMLHPPDTTAVKPKIENVSAGKVVKIYIEQNPEIVYWTLREYKNGPKKPPIFHDYDYVDTFYYYVMQDFIEKQIVDKTFIEYCEFGLEVITKQLKWFEKGRPYMFIIKAELLEGEEFANWLIDPNPKDLPNSIVRLLFFTPDDEQYFLSTIDKLHKDETHIDETYFDDNIEKQKFLNTFPCKLANNIVNYYSGNLHTDGSNCCIWTATADWCRTVAEMPDFEEALKGLQGYIEMVEKISSGQELTDRDKQVMENVQKSFKAVWDIAKSIKVSGAGLSFSFGTLSAVITWNYLLMKELIKTVEITADNQLLMYLDQYYNNQDIINDTWKNWNNRGIRSFLTKNKEQLKELTGTYPPPQDKYQNDSDWKNACKEWINKNHHALTILGISKNLPSSEKLKNTYLAFLRTEQSNLENIVSKAKHMRERCQEYKRQTEGN